MSYVVVTGASRGIGHYLCSQLAEEYEVVGVARNRPPDWDHHFIQADVTEPSQLDSGMRRLNLKRVYGLVNCAGIASMNLFVTTPLETARRILEVNTLGTINACSVFLPAMIRNGSGRVINFSSIAVKAELEGEGVYIASKAAVEAFSRVLAKEVGKFGITVNTVSPNPINTDLIAGVDGRKIDKLINERQAVKRKGELDDVLNIVRFYLDERSSLITAQDLALGGY